MMLLSFNDSGSVMKTPDFDNITKGMNLSFHRKQKLQSAEVGL